MSASTSRPNDVTAVGRTLPRSPPHRCHVIRSSSPLATGVTFEKEESLSVRRTRSSHVSPQAVLVATLGFGEVVQLAGVGLAR